MGTYTSLIGAVKINGKYRKLVSHFANYMYEEIEKDKEKYPFVKEFFKTERADWIPNKNPLSFFDDDFFENRLEDDVWYFSSDLKDYQDQTTGLSPIKSFFQNILAIVATDILILESKADEVDWIHQYYYSKNVINVIECVNAIPLDPIVMPFGIGDDEKPKDIFEKFKKEHGLD